MRGTSIWLLLDRCEYVLNLLLAYAKSNKCVLCMYICIFVPVEGLCGFNILAFVFVCGGIYIKSK